MSGPARFPVGVGFYPIEIIELFSSVAFYPFNHRETRM